MRIDVADRVAGLLVDEAHLGVDAEIVDPFENEAVAKGDVQHSPADRHRAGERVAWAGCRAHLAHDLRLAIHDLNGAVMLDLRLADNRWAVG